MISLLHVFPPERCMQFSSTRATCPAHLIVLDFIALVISLSDFVGEVLYNQRKAF